MRLPRSIHRPAGCVIPMRGMLVLFALALLVTAGCKSSKDKTLVLTGSSTVAPLAAEIGKRFEERHPGVRVDVQTGGSSRGIADARDGSADIGMASRALKDSEKDLSAHSIARDGIAIIVHQDNSVAELDTEQVRAVYTGKIDDWSTLDGEAEPLTVVTKASGRATLEVFCKYFELAEADIEAQVVIGDNQEAIKAVAGNPRAIAYVSIGTAEYEASTGAPIKLLRLDGVMPSTAAVADGSYPVYRPLNLITTGQPSDLAAKLISFARSKDVHDLVRAQHFVPIAP